LKALAQKTGYVTQKETTEKASKSNQSEAYGKTKSPVCARVSESA